MSKWKGNSHSIFKKKHPRFPQLGLCSLQSQCPPRPPVVDLSSTFLNHLPATQYTPRGHLLCLPSAQTRASYTLTHLPTTMSAGVCSTQRSEAPCRLAQRAVGASCSQVTRWPHRNVDSWAGPGGKEEEVRWPAQGGVFQEKDNAGQGHGEAEERGGAQGISNPSLSSCRCFQYKYLKLELRKYQ